MYYYMPWSRNVKDGSHIESISSPGDAQLWTQREHQSTVCTDPVGPRPSSSAREPAGGRGGRSARRAPRRGGRSLPLVCGISPLVSPRASLRRGARTIHYEFVAPGNIYIYTHIHTIETRGRYERSTLRSCSSDLTDRRDGAGLRDRRCRCSSPLETNMAGQAQGGWEWWDGIDGVANFPQKPIGARIYSYLRLSFLVKESNFEVKDHQKHTLGELWRCMLGSSLIVVRVVTTAGSGPI